MSDLSNKKSGQTVVSTVSGLQPVAPTLVGTLGHNGPLGGKFGQVFSGSRRLQPDGPGDLAAGGLGRVGQGLQDLRFALLGNTAGFIAAFLSPTFIAAFSETSGSNGVGMGPKLSVISGVFQRCFCQTARMLGSPPWVRLASRRSIFQGVSDKSKVLHNSLKSSECKVEQRSRRCFLVELDSAGDLSDAP